MIRPGPITGYIGINGSGKSLSAVAVAVRDWERLQRPVLTNLDLVDSVGQLRYDTIEELPDLLASVRREVGRLGVNVLADEVGVIYSSRDSGQNKAFSKTVQMLRKFPARLLWTAPTIASADKRLREVTLQAVLCHPLLSKHRTGEIWPEARLVMQKSFDISRIDQSGQAVNKNAKAKSIRVIRVARWGYAFDTLAVAGTTPQE